MTVADPARNPEIGNLRVSVSEIINGYAESGNVEQFRTKAKEVVRSIYEDRGMLIKLEALGLKRDLWILSKGSFDRFGWKFLIELLDEIHSACASHAFAGHRRWAEKGRR